MRRILFISALVFFASFISCKKKASQDGWTDTLTSGYIKIACDESFKALMDAEIDVFEARHNYNALITPIYTNEAEAIRLLVEDSVRFALTTRDLNYKEKADIESRKMEARKHLVAFDGVALITNNMNKDSIIGISTLEKILTGEITEWSQINSNSQIGTIRVIFDNNNSGVLRYTVDSISKGRPLTPNAYALGNSQEVIEKVAEMPNALGLVGINVLSDVSYVYSEFQNKIRLVRISKEENATVSNSYLPYAGDIVQENYPLWRPVYVLISDPRSGLSSGLSIFLSNEIGQKIILKSGLLPITDPHVIPVIISDEYPE